MAWTTWVNQTTILTNINPKYHIYCLKLIISTPNLPFYLQGRILTLEKPNRLNDVNFLDEPNFGFPRIPNHVVTTMLVCMQSHYVPWSHVLAGAKGHALAKYWPDN